MRAIRDWRSGRELRDANGFLFPWRSRDAYRLLVRDVPESAARIAVSAVNGGARKSLPLT